MGEGNQSRTAGIVYKVGLFFFLMTTFFAWGVIASREEIFPHRSIEYWLQKPPPTPRPNGSTDPASDYLAWLERKGIPFRGEHLILFSLIQAQMRDHPGFRKVREPAQGRGEESTEAVLPGEEERSELVSISYFGAYRSGQSKSNVTLFDKQKAQDGYNFYVSGHGPVALLLDMEGNRLHEWSFEYGKLLDYDSEALGHWRRAYLYENGDVLAIYNDKAMIRIDKDSKLIWSFMGGAHHAAFVGKDDKTFALVHRPRVNRRFNRIKPVLEDFITIFDSQGSVLEETSLVDCFESSVYAPILETVRPLEIPDIFHTNSLSLFDGSQVQLSPLFKKGNALISIHSLNLIAIIDLEVKQVVWALSGMWYRQHEPVLLKNGHMLIFDNLGYLGKWARILEFDPFTQEIYWSYTGTPDNRLSSYTQGSVQRLGNGNTLISETESGRVLEVTPDKEIVWEFYNPHRSGKNNELIATIPEMVRLPPDFPLDWLESKDGKGSR